MLQQICHKTASWEHMELNTHTIARARLQARLLTDTMTLQAHRARFYGKKATCRLYLLEDENVAHALMRCPARAQTHITLLQPMLQRMQDISDSPPEDDEDIIQVLLSYTSIQLLYNLGSNACYTIIHQCQALYPHC